jgi:4-oxalocrotonate tautomerase
MPVAHIMMLTGRTKEEKAAMATDITEAIHKHSGAPKEVITVIFTEASKDDWAAAGTLVSNRPPKA